MKEKQKIRKFKEYLGVPIAKDYSTSGKEKVFIGSKRGCYTFWFRTVKDARKFIKKYRAFDLKVFKDGTTFGLIPREVCVTCKNLYRYGSKEWKEAKENACAQLKERLKREAGIGGEARRKVR